MTHEPEKPPTEHETTFSLGEWLTLRTSFRGLVALIILMLIAGLMTAYWGLEL